LGTILDSQNDRRKENFVAGDIPRTADEKEPKRRQS